MAATIRISPCSVPNGAMPSFPSSSSIHVSPARAFPSSLLATIWPTDPSVILLASVATHRLLPLFYYMYLEFRLISSILVCELCVLSDPPSCSAGVSRRRWAGGVGFCLSDPGPSKAEVLRWSLHGRVSLKSEGIADEHCCWLVSRPAGPPGRQNAFVAIHISYVAGKRGRS